MGNSSLAHSLFAYSLKIAHFIERPRANRGGLMQSCIPLAMLNEGRSFSRQCWQEGLRRNEVVLYSFGNAE